MGVDIPVRIRLFDESNLKSEIRSGNRSLIFRFTDGEHETLEFGAVVQLLDRDSLSRGDAATAVLHCWRDEAGTANQAGQRIVVWYGSDIGVATVLEG